MSLSTLTKLSLAFASLTLVVSVAKADTFNVPFTNFSTGNSIVGTGTFSFDDVLGDGTYYLDALTNVNIDFTLGSTTFTNADVDPSNSSDVLVTIYNNGTNFYFDVANNDYGVHGGSLDFNEATTPNASNLSTEPNYYGNPPLDLFEATDSNGNDYFGTYDAPVPEPGTLVLLGIGLVGVAFRRHRTT